jgi:hypothetical protein
MHKFIHYKESDTPFILDRFHGLSEITGFQVQNGGCPLRYRFGQVVSRLNRSILLMLAGLFLSVSAFSQTPDGLAGPYPIREQPIQFSANQDKTPVDSQAKLILDRVLEARVFYPSSIQEPRRTDFHYSKFAGAPESGFRVEDRKIPGPGASIPIQLYTPNARTGPPLWEFFHAGSFMAGGPDTSDVPPRAATNRCDCPVVPAGYRLALENRYPAASENAYGAMKWPEGHAAEKDHDPRTLLSATPPGTFGLPQTPGSPQTPTSEAYRTGGNIDLTALAAHFRVGPWFRRKN